jgi:uncharacterized protein YbaP (TraB family)
MVLQLMDKNDLARQAWVGLFSLFFVCCITHTAAYAGRDGSIFLWSARSDKNTVYILGSVHVLREENYPLDERIEKAYLGSEKIVFEADMEEVSSPEIQMKMLSKGMYRDGSTLRQHISEKTYNLLKLKAQKTGMNMEQFDLLKPWLCAVTLSGLELKRLGFDPSRGIDVHFFTRARQDKKEMVFLESSSYQIDLISGLLEDNQEDLLKQSIKELNVIEEMSADLLNAWLNGDAQRMESIVSISLNEYPGIYDELFVQRNVNWVGRIEKLMSGDEDVLVIVGAGHLVGEKGVLAQLRQRGYSLVQH